jgi:hypothetical protein
VSFAAFMDAVAPGVLIAQAIGRIGNYFNQELFGAATTMPWGLEIDAASPTFPSAYQAGTLFQPTFLYELLWNLAGAALLIYLDRRFKLRFGRMFWLYVMVYTSGRLWIEMLRIDTAVLISGVRVNVWVALGTLLLGIGMFLGLGLRHRGQKDEFPARSLAETGGATARPAVKAAPVGRAASTGKGPKATPATRGAERPSKAQAEVRKTPPGKAAPRKAAPGKAESAKAAPTAAAKAPPTRKSAEGKPKKP